jgi:hypothetical protein
VVPGNKIPDHKLLEATSGEVEEEGGEVKGVSAEEALTKA